MAADDGEAVVDVRAGCVRCDWGEPGRESVALKVSLDGKYSQHLQLVRGEAMADYSDCSRPRGEGPSSADHRSRSGSERTWCGTCDHRRAGGRPSTPRAKQRLHRAVDGADRLRAAEHRRQVHRSAAADVVRDRADAARTTISLLGDLLQRGRRHPDRSADGDLGPHHRHRVRLRRRGRRRRTGSSPRNSRDPDTKCRRSQGKHEGRHPLVWVSTDNNMVSETGPTTHPLRAAAGEVRSDRHVARSGDGREPVDLRDRLGRDAARGQDRRRSAARASTRSPTRGGSCSSRPAVTSATRRSRCRSAARPAAAVAVRADLDGLRPRPAPVPHRPRRLLSRSRRRCRRARAPPTSARFACRRSSGRRPRAAARRRRSGATARASTRCSCSTSTYLPGPSILKWEGTQTIRAGGEPFEVQVP